MKTKLEKLNRKTMLASCYPTEPALIDKIHGLWIRYENQLHLACKCNGKSHTLALYKECYKYLRNILLELPNTPIQFCKSDIAGIPKPLWPIRSLIKGNRISKRVALTIAREYEVIRLPIDYNTTAIESPGHFGPDYGAMCNAFYDFHKNFSKTYPWYYGKLQFQETMDLRVPCGRGSGPNGPAIPTAHLDAKAVISDEKLYTSLSRMNAELKQTHITTWMENIAASFNSNETYLHGRLGFSAEDAGKTRAFAIGDYWTQLSLDVIQRSLNSVLSTLSTDATKDQEQGFKALCRRTSGFKTFCYDLSSASDRIPAAMQQHRIEILGGKVLAESWLSVMTERDFYIKATGQSVRWEVGQPLGLLSSFPSFALWHHDIVQFCYNYPRMKLGKPLRFFNKYLVLGDDIVIYDEKVACAYFEMMTTTLGIEINMSKSIKGSSEKSQIEFAKRLAISGVEMSSIRRNILTKSSVIDSLDLIEILIERDFIPNTGVPYLSFQGMTTEVETLLNFLIWFRLNLTPTFTGGKATCPIGREEFKKLILDKRQHKLESKAMDIYEMQMKFSIRELLTKTLDKHRVPHREAVLGTAFDTLRIHPFSWASTQTTLEFGMVFGKILNEHLVEPIEYLPIFDGSTFFINPKKGENEYFTLMVLETLRELWESPSYQAERSGTDCTSSVPLN